MKDPLLLGDGM